MNEFIKRKIKLELIFIAAIILFILAIILAFQTPLFAVFAVLSFAIIFFVSYKFKKLSTEFKKDYVQKEIVKLIDNATYEPLGGFTKDEVLQSRVLKRSDRFTSEDYLAGTVKNRSFRSCDLHLQDVRSTGKTTTVITVFRGRFFEIEFNKKFEEDVYIYPSYTARFGLAKGLTRCDVESILFNKTFDVYSKSKTSAFYLLKPRFMEKLLEFKNMYPKISYGFKDNFAYVALDTRRDAFDLIMFKKIDESFFQEINQEIKLIQDLIELIE